jgi:hypothetical protein
MPPKLYQRWLAIVFCAAVALVSFEAAARNSRRCVTLLRYDNDTGTADIINDCSECRKATIRRCDGTKFTVKVEGSAADSIPGSFGCTMQKIAESRCLEHRFQKSSRKSRKPAVEAQKDTSPITSKSGRPPIKPSDNHQTSPSVAANNQGTGAAKDVGTSAAMNSMQAANEPAGNKLVAVPPQVDTPGAQAKIKANTRTQMAAFADLSEHDWATLSRSEKGQSLIGQTAALLDRRAVLQIVLGNLWFSSDAVDIQKEWIAGEREVQAINRELNDFHKVAMAIIDGK